MSVPKPIITEQGVLLKADDLPDLPIGSEITGYAKTELEANAYLALNELWQDGDIEAPENNSWLIPIERLIHIESSIASALNLPRPDNQIHTSLRSSGIATHAGFSLQLEFSHPAYGRLDPGRQYGPAFIVTGGACVLLTPRAWKLVKTVDDAPPQDAASAARFEYIGRCVNAARQAFAEIDGYLVESQIDVIDEIGLDIQEVGDEIHLGVKANGFEGGELTFPNGKAKPFPSRRTPGGRQTRAVSSETAREKIEKIASKPILQGTEVPQFLQNPEAFLPEGIDLKDFSGRVRGFHTQVYNSRPYLHVNKEPRGWLNFDVGVKLDPVLGEGTEEARDISSDDFSRLVEEAKEKGERFVRHGDGWVEIDHDSSDQFISTIGKLNEFRSREPRPTARVFLDVIPNVELLEFEIVLPDDMVPERPWMDELPLIDPPAELRATLDEHQLLGFRWLSYLNENEAGGLLADEMGVGKTAQVIALLLKLHQEERLSPTLIVLPNALIPNWQEELAKFAPTLNRLHVHQGPGRTRSESFLSSMNVVLTTYDTARQDQVLLGKIDWQLVVADEAQFIKNPTAARTSIVKALKTKQALALTGTPVENGLVEFWCIMDYVQPGLLSSWSQFRTEFERPLVTSTEPETREAIVENLVSRLDPHFLRRLKENVLSELPEKKFMAPVRVGLSEIQSDRYQQILAEAREGGRGVMLGAITRLLMTCSHPRASIGDWETTDAATLINECPKLEATMDIISKVKELDEKVLLFTGWKATQKILQRAIWSRFDISVNIINGDVTSRRQELINQFRESRGFNVLILAPEVAGFGLNLIEANHVIHYTRPWNPAKENQATDRVHRRGQTKPVFVHYPTVAGTVEDRLAELLAEKAQLTRDVLRPTADRTVTINDFIDDVDLRLDD